MTKKKLDRTAPPKMETEASTHEWVCRVDCSGLVDMVGSGKGPEPAVAGPAGSDGPGESQGSLSSSSSPWGPGFHCGEGRLRRTANRGLASGPGEIRTHRLKQLSGGSSKPRSARGPATVPRGLPSWAAQPGVFSLSRVRESLGLKEPNPS